LYDSDAQEEFNFLKDKFINKQFFDTKEYRTMLQKFRKGVINKKKAAVKVLRRQRTEQQPAA
jgi:hypothetical protein